MRDERIQNELCVSLPSNKHLHLFCSKQCERAEMKENRLDGFLLSFTHRGEEQVGNHDSYLDELLVTDRYGSKALEAKRCRPPLSSYL